MRTKIVVLSYLLAVSLLAGPVNAGAQIRLAGYNREQIDARLYTGRWPAQWIAVDAKPEGRYEVCHFRKTFSLDAVPEQFVVHVSADNRYKLYVNGQFASLGPACGDVYNWNFETVDLAPLLSPGENTIAAVVWNFGDESPLAQISFGRTGFLLQGNTASEQVVDTDSSWSCARSAAYAPYRKPVRGYYAAGAGEGMDAAAYLWGWQRPDYDDSGWARATPIIQGAMKGAMDYPGWQLVPRAIPQMEMIPVRIAAVAKAEGVVVASGFPTIAAPLVVPGNSEAVILLDHRTLMTGYLTLAFSGGKGAEVEIGYAEALYQDEALTHAKGNRDEFEGKYFVGYADKLLADGGSGREYTTLWWRTWRYVRLWIKTANEPLVIDDVRALSSMYPLVRESDFNAPGCSEMTDILETGWRTARLCANEIYMDCPYYEQLQYLGDMRIQAMITLFNTRNDELVRSAIEHGRRSMVADGMTMSRYPSSLHQFIPSYSLWWICMGHDYWTYRGDEAYLKTLLPAYRSIVSWYEQQLKPDLSLGRIPFWFFVDWSEGMLNGEPSREPDGNSSIQDLQYLLAVQALAQMEAAFGSPALAAHYAQHSADMEASVCEKYWCAERGLFADTRDRRSFSQHANILAILGGVVTGEQATALFDRLVADKSLLQCTIYFRYYLQMAMKMVGRADLLSDNLDVWTNQLSLGLTTWAEQPEPSRSDCHAWGASPNIEFFRMVLGIDSAAPGFARVRIEPALGQLKEVSGAMPHPRGMISVKYVLSKADKLRAEVSLPEGIDGVFVWRGREYVLCAGRQMIDED